MSTSTTGRGPSISQHLRATIKLLQDTAFDTEVATTLGKAEVDDLERDAFVVLRLVRSLKNGLAPINQIPPEVLTLIPDYWGKWYKNFGIIPLTQVCRAWREMFSSRSSLWTLFYCTDPDKTRVYLKRSKSSPINLQILREDDLAPDDPVLQIIPHAIGRLKSLTVRATPETMGNITIHLSRSPPLLEHLLLSCGRGSGPTSGFVLPPSLFNGNLSSLRSLQLQYVRTELPWRNMVNLTSFTLSYTPLGELSIGQLLDFFESAPRLKKVELLSTAPTSGAQGGRLVSLARLEWIWLQGREPCSLLLDHLLIPVGATLSIWVDSLNPRLEDHLPRSLNNFTNITNTTNIRLNCRESRSDMQFSGPNGRVSVVFASPQGNLTSPMLGCLARIDTDTSKTEQLEICRANPPSSDPPHRALLHMENLRILKLHRCKSLHFFIHALCPHRSPPGAVLCPNLEELIIVLRTDEEVFDIEDLVNMATARELRGAKLKTVRIVGGQDKVDPGDVMELGKHVLDVECGPGMADGDSD